MKIEIDDFFEPMPLKYPPTEGDYEKAEAYIQIADAFFRATHSSIYIIDYYKKGFLYVSDNPLFLCGETPKQALRLGYEFYTKHVPSSDLSLLLQINDAGFKFYYNIPIPERLNYGISYDFHLVQKDGRLILINHKLTPLALDRQHNVWLALCVVTHSSHDSPGNIIITHKDGWKKFEYNLNTKSWDELQRTALTLQEKEILALSMQGFTMDEIAEKLDVAKVTIKFHRKNIFRKLKVNNISEAISYAVIFNIF